MIYLSEKEAIEYYSESLKKASSLAGEFLTEKNENKPRLFVNFIEEIKRSAAAAHALSHYQMNPKWLDTRDLLENIITVGMTLPQFTEAAGPLWLKIQESLDQMVEAGKKLATMKAMSRSDVLLHLDERAKKNLN